MTKLEAIRAVVRNIPQSKRIEWTNWSHGTEMTLSMTEDEAIQKMAELAQAIAANREANGDKG